MSFLAGENELSNSVLLNYARCDILILRVHNDRVAPHQQACWRLTPLPFLVSIADACRWHSACKPCRWLLWQQHGSPARPRRAQSRPQTCWCSTLLPGWHCMWPPGMSVTSASTCLEMTPACCPTHVSSGLTKQPRLLQRVSACKGPLCPLSPFPLFPYLKIHLDAHLAGLFGRI